MPHARAASLKTRYLEMTVDRLLAPYEDPNHGLTANNE